jgi:ribosome-associated protein
VTPADRYCYNEDQANPSACACMPIHRRVTSIKVAPSLSIDKDEIQFAFVRSTGPGGQNVNKVATAAQLRYDARTHLPHDVFSRLRRIAGSRLNAKGVLILTARTQRTQSGNRREALDRLEDLLRRAAIPPTPRTPTKPTSASRARRLEAKRKRGQSKARRRVTDVDE